MQLHVGQAALRGSVERYARHFNLVEVAADLSHLPRAPKLRKQREHAPSGFCFSVVLGGQLASLSPELAEDVKRPLAVASALGAGWLVLRTPSAVTPSPRFRRRLAELAGLLAPSGARVAWEAQGLWQEDDVRAVCRELGWHRIIDPAREEVPDVPVVYARVRALGEGARFNASLAERVADALAERNEVYLVIEGTSAVQGVRTLRRALGSALSAGDDDDAAFFDLSEDEARLQAGDDVEEDQ